MGNHSAPIRRYSRLYVTALLILVATLVAAVWHMVAIDQLDEQRVQATEHILALSRIHRELLEAETAQRAYLLVGDDAFRDEFDTKRRLVIQLLGSLADHGDGVERLRALGAQRLDALLGVIEVHDEHGYALAADAVRTRVGAGLMAEYAALSQSIVEADIRELDAIRQRATRINTILDLLLAAGTTLIIIMAGINLAAQRRDLRFERAAAAQLQTSGRRISQLNELNNNLLSCRDHAEAYAVIANALGRLFPETAGGVYAYRASRDILELQASWGEATGDPQAVILADECWALRRGHAHQHRSESDLACKHWARPAGVRSVCVPMVAQGDTVGLVFIQCADGCDEEAFFDDTVQNLAQTAASQVASAVANLTLRAALHQQSVKDPLTGLYNRRYLEETLQRELVRAQRGGTPLSIVMVDIDHFKAFNDLHGHQAGDLLLQRVGTVLADSVRGGDLACRYGGEEFTLVLPGAELELAVTRAEEIRAAIRRISVTIDGHRPPPITASFGVASFPRHGDDYRSVMQRADQALYQAKREGRDRVVVAN